MNEKQIINILRRLVECEERRPYCTKWACDYCGYNVLKTDKIVALNKVIEMLSTHTSKNQKESI